MMVLLALLAVAPPVAWVASHAFGLALPIDSLQLALWVIVLAPVLEEAVFRTLLQRGLFETLVSRTRHAAHLANLLTALAFAASHWPAQGSRALLWLVPALVIGEIWRRSEKLWMCVLTHSWFNACMAWTSAFG
jgi:membrane protease YdiL (CAAX protease family)